jgi:hypothetical protein
MSCCLRQRRERLAAVVRIRTEGADPAARISEQAERNMGNAQARGEAIHVVSASTGTPLNVD